MKKFVTILTLATLLFHDSFAGNYLFQESRGVLANWNDNDILGVYTTSATRIKFWMNNISEDKHNATISAYGWSLTDNTQYYSYYPYSADYSTKSYSITALPIKYTCQQQQGNGNLEHLAAYDFMTAQAKSTTGAIHFDYKHLGCILRIQCDLLPIMPYTTIRLSTSRNAFVSEATMNVTNSVLTPQTYTNTMVLNMDGIEIAKNDSLVGYAMMAPTDLSEDTIKVDIMSYDNIVKSINVIGSNMQPGKLYCINISEDNYIIPTEKKEDVESSEAKGLKQSQNVLSILYPNVTIHDFIPDEENSFKPLLGWLPGDADNDGTLTNEDANRIVSYYIGLPDVHINMKAADVNNDGKVTMADANEVINKLQNK